MLIKKLPRKNYNRYLLTIGFTVIILIMVFSSLYASIQMKTRSKLVSETTKQQNLNSELLGTMSTAILNRSMTIVEMLHTNDPFEADELSLKLDTYGAEFMVAREEFASQNLAPRLVKMLETQGHLMKLNGPMLSDISRLVQEEKKTEALAVFNNVTLPRQKINLQIINDMVDFQFWTAEDNLESLQKNTESILAKILVIKLLSVLISIFLTLIVLRKQKESDRKLEHQASTDALTELPNRKKFIKTIDWYIKQKPTTTFAVIFFDIDHFKSINDNYGHEVGDEVIKKFSRSIRASLKNMDVLARFGGDEFVLLLRSIKTDKEAKQFVTKLSSSLDTSYYIDENEIFITASIGASLYSNTCECKSLCADAKTLLKHADIAMYTAKKSGRNCSRFFSKETSDRLDKEHKVGHALQTILKNNNKNKELFLMYQPLTNISDGMITECEALIRWKGANGEVISPDVFIPLAEKTNLIEKINLFVVNEACRQQKEWQKAGVNNIRININLCGNKQIFNKLLTQFKYNLTHLKLNPSLFGIELTERTLNEISNKTISDLAIVRDQGVKISIDDFGTGYSSLSYLKKLPITTLKIDKEFIDGLPDDKDDQALVKAIITLGHSLDLDIVAEGVENQEQLEFLKAHACNTVQGFYFHRPLDSDQISKLKLVA